MKSSVQQTWSVGEVAARFGVPTNVLRHWETVGLLKPDRDPGGRRRYRRDDIARIATIQLDPARGVRVVPRLRVSDPPSTVHRRHHSATYTRRGEGY